ncbi:hypothetical protein NM688_g7512 [Phlebia brevispora]|uniref:Uncharacterized protein n=1 Tax=Phlebia brevispora TaxID=194682 RepID=A0ACC1S4Y3_9APHY|nr:hypothetical protein NM688_g7512 [Phlebia brevispora]
MSSSTPDAEIISAYRADLNYGYCAFAVVTIVCYDFIATFQDEYELAWKRKWTGATWLFLTNRCYNDALQYFLVELETLSTIVVAAFSALRVFALLGHAYIPAAFTFALGLVPVAYQSSQVTYHYVDDPVLGSSCYTNFVISPSVLFDSKNYSDHIVTVLTHLIATLAGTLSTIAADVIAIAITWIKTYRHVREALSIGANVSLGQALLQYGSLYFILPNIILSHFLINLRQINAAESGTAARLSRFSPLNFRVPSIPSIPSIVGNLGEPLADNEDDLAEAFEDRAGSAVNSSEGVETSEGMHITSGEVEEVWISFKPELSLWCLRCVSLRSRGFRFNLVIDSYFEHMTRDDGQKDSAQMNERQVTTSAAHSLRASWRLQPYDGGARFVAMLKSLILRGHEAPVSGGGEVLAVVMRSARKPAGPTS